VVTFASMNFQLKWHTMVEAMQGGIAVEGKVMQNWTGADTFKRWTEDRYIADLFVWLQIDPDKKPYQASFFTKERSPHRPLVEDFTQKLRSLPLSPADNNWLLQ
jgi:hypothetical protein